MFVVLSSSKILNLAHVAWIDPFKSNSVKIRLACGQFDVISNVTEEDYLAILEAISKEANGGNSNKNSSSSRRLRAATQEE